jgi:serine protease Do
VGISVQDVTQEQARSLGMESPKGAAIADVVAGGPADKGGLKKGDVVTLYQGKTVTNGAMLRNEVAIAAIGSDVRLTVLRGGKKQEITLKIGGLQDAAQYFASSTKEKIGAGVRALTPKETERYGLEENQGVALASVEPRGPLGRAGFEVGDLILEVNGQAVAGPQGFADLISALKPQQRATLLAVDQKSGKSGYIQITVK